MTVVAMPRCCALVAVLPLLLLGCGGDAVGRCGAYTDTAGTATITAIATAPATESDCTKDPVAVTFDFAPADPAKVALVTRGARLTVGSGQNPPRAWVSASALTVGSTHPAVRSDQPAGPCTPTVFALGDVDMAAAVAACY